MSSMPSSPNMPSVYQNLAPWIRKLNDFLDYFKSIHSNIQFTMETDIWIDTSPSWILIYRMSGRISTNNKMIYFLN
jgi:hypothetical protein